jgi:MFS family permease
MPNSEEERLDQEWGELLEEVRVVLPGTEVLFAFLLGLPFTSRFAELRDPDRTAYTIAFLAAGIATLLLIAPSAQHRLLWRQHRKEQQLKIATGFALAGTAFTALAIASAVFLVMDVLYTNAISALVAAGAVGIILGGWYALPLTVRFRR